MAWLVASGVKLLVSRALAAGSFEKRVMAEAGDGSETDGTVSETIGEALYWFIFLLFLPGILSALQLQGMVQPVESMMNEVIGFLPNLFAAGATLGLGWLIARIVQRIVSSFAAAAGMDSLGEKTGIQAALGSQRLSTILGKIVYVLVFIMLNTILSAVPAVFAALLVLAAAYWIARVVSGLVSNLLDGIGFNTVLERLGLGKASDSENRRPSAIVGSIVLVLILLFAATEAASLLGFEALEEMTTQILGVAGHVLFGIVLFGFGLALANFVADAISSTRAADAPLLSTLAKVATLVLTGAIALRQMGVANEIIESAFTLTLGSVAVAAAISFGFGGRELAGRHLEKWSKSLERGSQQGQP
ncbi:MAG: mechanosensitive ion channel [Acidobacteria bacterium]|nr:mechanosensitive ion channel [Acidobacteriota bacterium]MDA1237016.1 mechanosensitive ion channel [Acidobacteriota bacterium]